MGSSTPITTGLNTSNNDHPLLHQHRGHSIQLSSQIRGMPGIKLNHLRVAPQEELEAQEEQEEEEDHLEVHLRAWQHSSNNDLLRIRGLLTQTRAHGTAWNGRSRERSSKIWLT